MSIKRKILKVCFGSAGTRQSPLKESKEVIVVRSALRPWCPASGAHPAGPRYFATPARAKSIREAAIEEEADDVIDLGAPRHPRRRLRPGASLEPAPRLASRSSRPPNPRLYPGAKAKPEPRTRRPEGARIRRRRRGKRAHRLPLPNSRLYRPTPPLPPAPPPPPAVPRAKWSPPLPPRSLDTASRAALRVLARAGSPPSSPALASSPTVERVRQLVVKLPATRERYRPTSEHYRVRASLSSDAGSGASTPPAARLRPVDVVMEPPSRRSASPEDRSEGNETLSAPSEFLAEFLSAIMRRQYAEALKYCRLILQYEPHNATARGFYPLLRTKVARAQRTETAAAEGVDSSGDEAAVGAGAGRSSAGDSPSRQEEDMSHSAEESEGGSEASAGGEHSSLELDSSDALHSSQSLSLSRHTDRTDSASASAGCCCWDSSASGERSDPGGVADDNGNAAPALPPLLPDDLENDNAADTGARAASNEPHHSTRFKGAGEALSSLQRLRAQFACSIK